MAPARIAEPDIDRSDEYEAFMKVLEEYHGKRGTTLEREPKIGSRQIDLLRLYNRVIEDGGYDRVSDTKGNKLAWRKITQDFYPNLPNLPAMVFMLKTAYYKNLAAYEISTHWKRDPPPREILEDITAKGGDLLNRTVENFQRPGGRESLDMNGAQDGGEEDNTKDEKMDTEEPGSSGRVTRGLRQAPQQRVPFQPDPGPVRPPRAANQAHSPTPGYGTTSSLSNGLYTSNGVPATIATYEPRPQIPLSLKPVITPGNNPSLFRQKRMRPKDDVGGRKHGNLMLPGTGFPGPNIYVRAQLALASGIPAEEDYALHHLVKISHERGEKYRFDQFPGLADALLKKVLGVTRLFYDEDWEVSYDENAVATLDASSEGSHQYMTRFRAMTNNLSTDLSEGVLPQSFVEEMVRIVEATLVLRNMVMLDANAVHLAGFQAARDFVTITLDLPEHSSVTEMRHYTLELLDQLARHWLIPPHDPLYAALLTQTGSSDRTIAMSALRLVARITVPIPAAKRLTNVSAATLERLLEWLTIEDEELKGACLDFFHQYTTVVENIETLCHTGTIENLVAQLTQLLLYGAHVDEPRDRPRPQNNPPSTMPVAPPNPDGSIPKLSQDIIHQLLKYEEPDRSSHWLRACFEPDDEGEMTQISLWHAYQSCFHPFLHNQAPMLIAGDFIKNVSHTFPGASAQVANQGQKYIIKGIRPRSAPVDTKGRKYLRCQWSEAVGEDTPMTNGASENIPPKQPCKEFVRDTKSLWNHIIQDHLSLSKSEDGKWNLQPQPGKKYNCLWGSCRHFARAPNPPTPFAVGMHVKTHLHEAPSAHKSQSKYQLSAFLSTPGPTTTMEPMTPGSESKSTRTFLNTAVDERNDATGLPLLATLIMQNLVRGLRQADLPVPRSTGFSSPLRERRHHRQSFDEPKHSEGQDGMPQPTSPQQRQQQQRAKSEATETWLSRVFGPVKDHIFYVLAHNLTLSSYLASLARAIADVEVCELGNAGEKTEEPTFQ